MPNKMKSMPTVVGVDIFMTGRMELRLKTGLRASSKEGGSGREQFSMTELLGAIEKKTKCNNIRIVKVDLTFAAPIKRK